MFYKLIRLIENTNVITWAPHCCMIRCISSWTSSTQRSDGSSSRLICRFTSNSNDTSGTNKLGRGPLKIKIKADFNFSISNIEIKVFEWNFNEIFFSNSITQQKFIVAIIFIYFFLFNKLIHNYFDFSRAALSFVSYKILNFVFVFLFCEYKYCLF